MGQQQSKNQNDSELINDYLILEKDNRHAVPQPIMKKHPFDCYGLLLFKKGKKKSAGTAFLIANDLIVTSAHNILSKEDEDSILKHTNFTFFPAVCGEIQQPNKVEVLKYHPKYLQGLEKDDSTLVKNYDYALLKLKRKVVREKYFEIGSNFNAKNANVSVYGYHAQKIFIHNKQTYLMGHQGKVMGIKKASIEYSTQTTEGQSGSPVTISSANSVTAIGIHRTTLAEKQHGIGTLFTSEVIQNIVKWQQQMKPSQIKIKNYKKYQEFKKFIEQEKEAIINPKKPQAWIKQPQIISIPVSPKKLQWDFSKSFSKCFEALNKKIVFKEESKGKWIQLCSKQPVTNNTTVNFKIMGYGVHQRGIIFGVLTENRKKYESHQQKRNQKGILYYWSRKQIGKGYLFINKKQLVPFDERYYVAEGQNVRMEISIDQMKIALVSGGKRITTELDDIWKSKKIFIFVEMRQKGDEIQIQ